MNKRSLEYRLARDLPQLGPDECWPWQGTIHVDGYGHVSVNGTTCNVHRVIYEREIGPIPEGMSIDHECHNRAARLGHCAGGRSCPHRRCANPRHLVARTPVANASRGNRNQNVLKTHCDHGHEFTPENTRWYRASARDGGEAMYRQCRTCKLREKAEWRQRERERRVLRRERVSA